jgi:WD40 repeat protein
MPDDWDPWLQTLEGHDDDISMVGFSPDGRLLALADKSRIQLWDPVTGACKQTLNGAERCERFVFSPDGRQLASWGRAYWIVLWDPLSGARTQALESKQASETDTVAFSPCSRWLAAVCYHAVRVWDAATGELTQEMYTGRGFDVLSLAFSPDGRWLVFPHHSEVVVWDLETRALAHTLKGHYQIVRFVAFSADGRLASSDRWMSIRFWDPITGACISSTKPNGSPSFIAFSPNSRWLMAFGNMFGNMTTQLWDPETGDCAQTLEHGVVMSAAFSADSRWVASAGASGTIRLWDPATGACVRELKAHNGKAMSVAFSPNGRWLASGGDRVVRICDPTLPNPQTHDGHCETNSVAAASSAGGASGMAPDRDVLEPTVEPQVGTHEEISWGKAMAAFVRQHPWTPEGPTVKPRVEESNDSSMVEAVEAVKTVAFSPDGRWLASFTPGTVKIWDPATGAQRHTLKGREGEMESVRYSPDSRWLASFGSYDHDPEIGLWDLATGTRVQTLRGHSTRIESVVFSDDNSRVASFGVREWGLGLIRLWDPATGECTRTLEGHRVGVRSVKFSPDSRWLWSVGADRNDKRLRLWDAATGVRRRTLWARYGDDPDAFSSNGHWLVSAHANRSGAKRTVGLWGPTLESTRRQYDGRILWLKGQDSFNELALSADGRWLAVSGPGNGQIQLWRAGRGEYLHIRTLQGVSYSKWELVVFSPDGRRLATAGRTLASTDPGIQLWDTETGKCVHKIKQHSHIASIAFSPDGRLLASAGTELNFTVRLWDPATGVCTQTIDDIHTAAFSPDGRWFAVGRCRRSRTGPVIIQLWDSTIGTYTQTLKGHGVHGCMAFSPDSRWLASVGRGVIQIWNPATGACRWTFKDPRRVTLVGFSPNNQWLVASDVESLRLWDLCTGAYDTIYQPDPKYGRYYRPHQNVGSVAFSLDGRWLVWATDPDYCNGSIRLYQLAKKRYGEDRTFETGGRIVSLEFSPDSSLFAAAVETTVQLWNPAAVGKAARVRALECGRLVKAATFSPDGRQLAAADECSTIWLWDVSTGACLRTVEVDGRHTPTAIMFSPDGSHLALFGKVGWLWSLETGACTRAFQGHADVKAVAFSPTNKWLASFGIDEFDRTIQLWDPVTGSCVRTLEGHRNVGSVVFSPTSSALLASAGRDTVRLWDLARDGDACIQSLEDQHWASVAFSPCGDWLVSASISSFRLVDLKTGVCTHELQGIGHSPDVLESIGFSPDGQWLVSGSGRWIRLQGRAADAIQEPRDEPACQDHKLGIRDAWIVRGEEHMLWLPAEYRPSCWAVAGSKVAMGCPSGRVLILDIDNRRADL